MNNKNDDIDILMKIVNVHSFENKLQKIFGYKISFQTVSGIIKDNEKYIIDSLCMLKHDLIENINNKKKLLQFIESKLSPRENEKRENGEVFTPISFIENTMLNLLEKENPCIFTNKNYKWLDPANGIGNFPICLYYRLMVGLKNIILDEKERKRHIIENMIYVCEIDKTNIEIYSHIMTSDVYKLNIYEGDYINFSPNYFKVERFDVVLGNPPYQKNTKEGSYGSSLPFYNEFIIRSLCISDKVLFVTPSRWFAGGKGLDKFRKNMLQRTDIKVIDHFSDSKKIFSHVDIKGGVNVLFIDNQYNGLCRFITNGSEMLINISDYDIISDPKYIGLINMFMNTQNLDSIFKTRGLYKLETNDKRLTDTKAGNTKCYVSKQKGFVKYVDKTTIKNYNDNRYYKVITARAAYKGGSGFGNMFLSTPDEVYTNSYISFVTKTEKESEYLISYMKCKLPNVMLGLRKISQDISEKTCKWIPLVPLDRIWTDDKVSEYFKLSEEYISLIDDYINEYNVKIYSEVKSCVKDENIDINIEFEEVSLIYPNGSSEDADSKKMSKFNLTKLKKIAFDNKIDLNGIKQVKCNIIKKLMSLSELNIIE